VLAAAGIRRLDLFARRRVQDAFDGARITSSPSLSDAQRGDRLVIAPATAEAPPPDRAGLGPVARLVRRWPVAVAGIAFAALFGSWITGLWPEARDWTLWHVERLSFTGSPSSCSDPGWLRQVDQRANAFYQLNAYPAHNTDDANKDTAWVGRFRGNGHDEIAWRLGGQPP
jgi:hypothetical protein